MCGKEMVLKNNKWAKMKNEHKQTWCTERYDLGYIVIDGCSHNIQKKVNPHKRAIQDYWYIKSISLRFLSFYKLFIT